MLTRMVGMVLNTAQAAMGTDTVVATAMGRMVAAEAAGAGVGTKQALEVLMGSTVGWGDMVVVMGMDTVVASEMGRMEAAEAMGAAAVAMQALEVLLDSIADWGDMVVGTDLLGTAGLEVM